MTVRELIDELERYPDDMPVVVDSCEAEQIIVRTEVYYSSEKGYSENTILKIY